MKNNKYHILFIFIHFIKDNNCNVDTIIFWWKNELPFFTLLRGMKITKNMKKNFNFPHVYVTENEWY